MRSSSFAYASVFASLTCLAALAGIAPACSSAVIPIETEPLPDGGQLPDGATVPDSSPGADADASQPCVPGQVWKASSARVEVSSFGFFEGSTGYDAKRADLSAAQLTALDKLCVIPPPQGPIGADYTSYRVRITDSDGTVTSYRAAQDNIHDSDEGPIVTPTLDVHSLEPFLATFSCLEASQTRGGPVDAGGDPWSTAPTASDDPSCLDGVFAPYGCGDVHVKLDIRAAGARHLALQSCFDVTRLRLLAADGVTELAASAAATAPTCASLDYTFPSAGTYDLVIEKKVAAGCSENGTAGDMILRVQHAP